MPAVPGAGVPLSDAVPSPLSTKVTPAGSAAPPRVSVGDGKPVVVTVNVPGAPIGNVTAFALVIAGGCCTVSVKFCVAGVPTPFAAVNVSG